MGGGVDRECRGADWDDDSPGYFSMAHASSLARCQARTNMHAMKDAVVPILSLSFCVAQLQLS